MEQVKRLVTDYDNYISLKLAGDDAYLSEKMVGYPAELDEVYTESFEEQKKEWFSCVGDGIQECRNTWEHKKWNITDLPEFELAITIDRPELYYDFLQKDWTRFCHDYWKNNFLEHHTLSKKRVTRIYIGNQFCHNLFPRKELLFQVLEKALENNLAVTLAFSYIRNHLLEEIDELLQDAPPKESKESVEVKLDKPRQTEYERIQTKSGSIAPRYSKFYFDTDDFVD